MSPVDLAYYGLNALVIPAWLLLLLRPGGALTRKLVHSHFYPFLIGGIYLGCLIAAVAFGQAAADTGFSSAAAAAALYDHPNGIILGWSHYLVFDLFIGAWIARNAVQYNLPHWRVAPCLLLTYGFGPAGLMLYLAQRYAVTRSPSLTLNSHSRSAGPL